MHSEDSELAILATTRNARQSAELALVLEARAIEVVQERVGRSWILRVPVGQLDLATEELAAYARENVWKPEPATDEPIIGSGWPGVIVYVAILVGMLAPVSEFLFGRDWLSAGRLDSAAIFTGEWWRAVTALTLHADAAHLLGNAAFGSFFGYSLARSFGSGFAWLAILATGVVGNLGNAWLSGPDHRAIGASTAVFGALGILTAYSWRTGFRRYRSPRQRIAPIVAGIGLLAFTGTAGENTDIGAHLLGFVAGFALGAGIAAYGAPRTKPAQLFCAAAALAIVAGSWALALTA
jgi:rhomboid protease GluP